MKPWNVCDSCGKAIETAKYSSSERSELEGTIEQQLTTAKAEIDELRPK